MAERTIRHGLFTYYEPIETINQAGDPVKQYVERMAFRGQTVDIPRQYDLDRGEEHGAFFTEVELAERNPVSAAPSEEDEEDEAVEVELADLPQSELVDWLMSTGEFDGQKKPTAEEVVAAAEDDPELADRLLTAEATASGDNPRKTVTEGLTKIKEGAGTGA